jgi:major vault protein
MATESQRDRELVLPPNMFAYVLDKTKGKISVNVGPHKSSLSNTDQLVVWDSNKNRWNEVDTLDQAIQSFVSAPEGSYLVLHDPADTTEESRMHPTNGSSSEATRLKTGRKINIAGPVSFPLWPGQTAEMVPGHHLRSNQFLVVLVYNDVEANSNWDKAVMKPVAQSSQADSTDKSGDSKDKTSKDDAAADKVLADFSKPKTMGQKLIIKGTEFSFYIPPTGVEVVQESGNFVREAVTLEQLEYCVLLGEDGTKNFKRGPAVVFPEPTQSFIDKDGSRRFKAKELNPNSGIYVKVTAAYEEEGKSYKVGDELFITGKDTAIYFSRPEHALISYGEGQYIHYATAIPEGEGRYVMNRDTGEIKLKRGPCMYLPDPRSEVIVNRVLEARMCDLLYPGNTEALEYNRKLREQANQNVIVGKSDVVAAHSMNLSANYSQSNSSVRGGASELAPGDAFTRKPVHTPPRTITLDNKFQGAVSFQIWNGYAVQIVNKKGERRVEVGPKTVMLEYDETLMPMQLSKGKPKTDDARISTVFLSVKHNKVSDMITVQTVDLVEVKLTVSYRVNFEGKSDKWFDVDNYVKLLTDHLRSKLRGAAKRVGIESYYAGVIDSVRDTVLGKASEGQKRPGAPFEENGMRVYDVEVLDVVIADNNIQQMLSSSSRDAVLSAIKQNQAKRELVDFEAAEDVKRKKAQATAATEELNAALNENQAKRELELKLKKEQGDAEVQSLQLKNEQGRQEAHDEIGKRELAREKKTNDQRLAWAKAEMEVRIAEMKARAESYSPELIAAMQTFSDKLTIAEVSKHMAPMALLGGESFVEVARKLFAGTNLAGVLDNFGNVAKSTRQLTTDGTNNKATVS